VDVLQLEPGAILITAERKPAEISWAAPNNRLESAGEGAERAARAVLDTPALGHPQLEAVAGVIGFAASPFAAAYGAIQSSKQRLSPDKLVEAEAELVKAMQTNASPDTLCQKVADAGRLRTHRVLVCASEASVPPTNSPSASGKLEVGVESLRLEMVTPGENKYVLAMQVSARLIRVSDGVVLANRSYNYRSGISPYSDWTSWDAVAVVAETGYQVMAEQIAAEMFRPVARPAIRLGAGQKHSEENIPRRNYRWVNQKREADFLLVSYGEEPPAPFEVYTRGAGEGGIFPSTNRPPSESGGTDTEWAFDGLENDRNFVVQFTACIAAVPFGLWEQTYGAWQKHAQEKTDKIVGTLKDVAVPRRIEKDLAAEVTRRLRVETAAAVKQEDVPLSLALAKAGDSSVRQIPAKNATESGATALELEVVSATLVGKNAGSRSRALEVEIRATVIRKEDGQELCFFPIQYRSTTRKLKEWSAKDAQLLRKELAECAGRAAEAIAKEAIEGGFVRTNGSTAKPERL